MGNNLILILSRSDSISNLELNLRIHGPCAPDAHAGADLQAFLFFCFKPILLSAHKLIKPPHWTVNSCLGAFRSVWVHFGLFHYCTKLDAKWVEMVELMHKFVARSRIGIFRNECTRTTQLDPKLMFCVFHSVWVHLRTFHYCTNSVQNGLNWYN